jgi:hypothetical protein
MRVPRLLFFFLLVSLGVATAAAQSSPDKSSGSHLRTLPPETLQQETLQQDNDSVASQKFDSPTPHILTLQQDEKTCYTLRTYRVARETPDSDSTRPAGYSTCQRATRFQLKTAEYSREIGSR